MPTPTFRILLAALLLGIMGGAFGTRIAPQLAGEKASERAPVPTKQEERAGTLEETKYLDEESATIDVVNKTNQAVVSINIFQNIPNRRRTQTIPFDDFPFFGFPFEIQVPDNQSQPETSEPVQVGGGSGFIIKSDGLIVTNRHVVDSATAKYKVVLADGKEYEARLVAKDPVLDVAFLDIDAENLPIIPLGDSDKLKLGQTVIAIGYALAEFGNTVTRGVVSGINRRVVAGDNSGMSEVIEEAIQTDAAINPGNSGGPLLNLAGEVVGINTAVSSRGQTVGFAIPINSVKRTIESVQREGKIVRPWLGVRYTFVTPALAKRIICPLLTALSLCAAITKPSSPSSPALQPTRRDWWRMTLFLKSTAKNWKSGMR